MANTHFNSVYFIFNLFRYLCSGVGANLSIKNGSEKNWPIMYPHFKDFGHFFLFSSISSQLYVWVTREPKMNNPKPFYLFDINNEICTRPNFVLPNYVHWKFSTPCMSHRLWCFKLICFKTKLFGFSWEVIAFLDIFFSTTVVCFYDFHLQHYSYGTLGWHSCLCCCGAFWMSDFCYLFRYSPKIFAWNSVWDVLSYCVSLFCQFFLHKAVFFFEVQKALVCKIGRQIIYFIFLFAITVARNLCSF